MKVLDKIEIKHFRSFDGGKLQPKVEIIDLNEVNIFSGSNDSGKSNVLRALNLFFNNEISPGLKFNIERDLSVIQRTRSNETAKQKRSSGKKDVRQKDLWVKIKIHFKKEDGGMLPNRFFVEKVWDRNGLNFKRNSNIETMYKKESKEELNTNRRNALEGQLTQFLNKIQFEYIPAIKDRNFFYYLFSKLQNYLFEKEGGQINRFKEASKNFNKILTDETINLFNEFKDSSGVNASFNIPSTLIDFFRTLSVKTENNISLFDRGDGIQARFIPEILNEISKSSQKKIIWGFEEPENSYESRNIKKLMNDFVSKYSKTKQIFITTHSREILSSEGMNISIYRVYMTSNHTSQIEKYIKDKGFDRNQIKQKFWVKKNPVKTKNEKKVLLQIYEDLGIIKDARIIEQLQKKLFDQDKIINESKLSNDKKDLIQRKLTMDINDYVKKLNLAEKEVSEYKKPSIFFEDEYLEIYKVAWLKLNDLECDANNFNELFDKKSPFILRTKKGSKSLEQFLDSPSIKEWEDKKIMGIFDFDAAFNHFNGLSKDRWSAIKGVEKTGLYRKRKDHNHFFSMLLPVPKIRGSYASKILKHESILTIELYFSDNVLKKLNNSKSKDIPGGNKIIIFKGSKKLFWKKLFDLKKNEFDNFKLLFDNVNTYLH